MTKISILGSTGSIGQNCLEVISRSKNKWDVVGLSAGRNRELFRKQVTEFNPKIISLEREEDVAEFRREYPESSAEIFHGQEGAEAVARYDESDIVLSAITGINGLRPTLGAVQSGKRVALANKESLVVAGPLILETAERTGSQIIPVDSEHSGVFQCLAKEEKNHVKKVILTASGGPFFHVSAEEMKNKTLDEALNHPRWKMGKKVTIDSATLMNKGLELIEARWLFDLEPEQLDMLIHPQSIVHSLVEMRDGSVLAQLSPTDMKIPIQYALTYPDREEALLPSLDLSQVRALEFYEIDEKKFPLVKLAREALETGGSLPVVLNTANEVAVEAFIEGKIPFSDIAEIVTETVENHKTRKIGGLEEIFDIDRETKLKTRNLIDQR
ncbi:MAG: 1-deoxy-D-xylulose-5-phosphate reductoisomerase [Candidatus Aminicenantes bacterium]|nr:MAG: 1-deoxy-D-xylulose-5-phosphate reductoisomerase [Candidatus Aminicenantes bacterium]